MEPLGIPQLKSFFCLRFQRAVHARRTQADRIGICGVSWTLQLKALSRLSGGSGSAGVEASKPLVFTEFGGLAVSKTSRLPLSGSTSTH